MSLSLKSSFVTAGTLFDKTRKPLRSWFHVAWEITNAKQGVNALTMQHRLGLRSYQTAWSWLHKFRRAMVRPDRDRLTGEVEVDEAYVGGEETGVRGRQTKTKSIVLIAVEVRGADDHGAERRLLPPALLRSLRRPRVPLRKNAPRLILNGRRHPSHGPHLAAGPQGRARRPPTR